MFVSINYIMRWPWYILFRTKAVAIEQPGGNLKLKIKISAQYIMYKSLRASSNTCSQLENIPVEC